ncbi:PaaX family transcriptional regulator [Gryllotalpicola koreensis]|uniref:PaaX family transcriptional regulator n=1 Tax=Gryllotalpicola koreensis TaxID=993086 RepID=UPI0031CFE2A2
MTYFYHAVVDSPHIPRDLEADSAQSAVITLLGELWPSEQPIAIPSAAIVAALSRIDVTEAATRAALSRMHRKGTLDIIKDGRQTLYRLSDAVITSIPASQVLTMGFGAESRPWNGEWTVVVFSLPETQRDRRQALREWLRWLGFGPVRDGVWISPHANIELVQRALHGLLPSDGLVFRSAHIVGEVRPGDVWPLAEIEQAYRTFIDEFRPYIYSLRGGLVPPAEAMRLWITVLCRWRGFPTLDPDLPAAALPADWPRGEARRVFEAVHDATGPLVSMLMRSVIGEFSKTAAAAVRTLTVDEARALYSPRAATPSAESIDLNAIGPTSPAFLPTA